jgi:hypothetical protein
MILTRPSRIGQRDLEIGPADQRRAVGQHGQQLVERAHALADRRPRLARHPDERDRDIDRGGKQFFAALAGEIAGLAIFETRLMQRHRLHVPVEAGPARRAADGVGGVQHAGRAAGPGGAEQSGAERLDAEGSDRKPHRMLARMMHHHHVALGGAWLPVDEIVEAAFQPFGFGDLDHGEIVEGLEGRAIRRPGDLIGRLSLGLVLVALGAGGRDQPVGGGLHRLHAAGPCRARGEIEFDGEQRRASGNGRPGLRRP